MQKRISEYSQLQLNLTLFLNKDFNIFSDSYNHFIELRYLKMRLYAKVVTSILDFLKCIAYIISV